MKIYSLFLCLSLLLFFSKNPADRSLDEDLIAYYSFNNCDARDDSGKGSHGVLYGSIDCWCGVEDDGLLLDGARDYIEFPGIVNRYFSTSDFTVSFYFKPEKYSTFPQSLLSKREKCEFFHMLDILLDLNGEELLTSVLETPRRYYPGLSPAISSTGWQHFALVREGQRAATYINGQLQQESYLCSGIDISNDAVLSFSNSPCIAKGEARRFKGVIDELRVYDRALTPEEIWRLYSLYPIENAQMDCYSYMPAPCQYPEKESRLAELQHLGTG
jgi:hypothetical protein